MSVDFRCEREVLLRARGILTADAFTTLLGHVDAAAEDVDVAAPVAPSVELVARGLDAVTPPQTYPAIRLSVRTRHLPTVGPGACQNTEHDLQIRVFVAGDVFADDDWSRTTQHGALEQVLVLGRAACFALERGLAGGAGIYNVQPLDASEEPDAPYPSTHPSVLRGVWSLRVYQRTTTGRRNTQDTAPP